jgi:hypothetical protein
MSGNSSHDMVTQGHSLKPISGNSSHDLVTAVFYYFSEYGLIRGVTFGGCSLIERDTV